MILDITPLKWISLAEDQDVAPGLPFSQGSKVDLFAFPTFYFTPEFLPTLQDQHGAPSNAPALPSLCLSLPLLPLSFVRTLMSLYKSLLTTSFCVSPPQQSSSVPIDSHMFISPGS